MSDEKEVPHITDQMWWPDSREDGVYLVGEDGSVVLKLGRPDHGSDLFIAGYIAGLQGEKLRGRKPQ